MRIVFHLGFPRTATTFLQSSVFPKHKEINFLGPKNYNNWDGSDLKQFPEAKISEADLDKITLYSDEFMRNKEDLLTKFYKIFDKDKINVISNERYTTYLNFTNNFKDIKHFEILLNEKFGNVNLDFIIVIRNQYELIKSAYFNFYPHLSKFLNKKKFEDFMNCFKKDIDNNHRNFPLILFLKNYNFYSLYNDLSLKFKNSNIKFLFFEDLVNEKEVFVNSFADFLNLDKLYTKELFYQNNEYINALKKKGSTIIYNSTLEPKLSQNSFIKKIKNFIPPFIKDGIKRLTLKKQNISREQDNIYNQIIKDYYKNSNINFFRLTKISNKYLY